MIKITYYSAYSNMKNIYNIRYKIVRYALEYNVSAAARGIYYNSKNRT